MRASTVIRMTMVMLADDDDVMMICNDRDSTLS